MTFAALKKALQMESSGNLQHHLGKLGGLVKQTDNGLYALSDDGREALRVLDTIREADRTSSPRAERVRAMDLLAWTQDRRFVAMLTMAAFSVGIVGLAIGMIGLNIAPRQVDLLQDLHPTLLQDPQPALPHATEGNAFGIPVYVLQNGEWLYVGFIPTVGPPVHIDVSATYTIVPGTPH